MRILETENNSITIKYDYPTHTYTILNEVLKETPVSTSRSTAKETLEVLKVLIPTTSITIGDLLTLAGYTETIDTETSLSFIYDTTYYYIKAVAFNDHTAYALEIDPTKAVLSINNSNIYFDLTLTEATIERLNLIKDFYFNTLKIDIPLKLLNEIYSLLLKSYYPQVVNQISITSNKVTGEYQAKYTTNAILNNFSNTSKSVYTITNSTVSNTTLNKVASIYNVSNSSNIVSLVAPPTKEIKVGDTIQLFNTNNTILNEVFSNDGTYEVAEIISNTEIRVTGLLPITYTTPTPTFYMAFSEFNISSSSINEGTIVVTRDVASELSVGDEIQVMSTTVTGEYGSKSTLDGIYTVKAVNGSTIFVNETIPYNYNYSSSYERQGILFKKTSLGEITNIVTSDTYSIVTLLKSNTLTLNENSTCAILNIYGEYELGKIANTSITSNRVNVKGYYTNAPVNPFEAQYGELRKDILGEAITVEVTESSNENKLPIGKFILLNSDQCSNYLGLLKDNTLPEQEVYSNFGKEVKREIVVEVDSTEYKITMKGEL